MKQHRATERNRGRDEQRECFVIAAPKELRAQGQWQDLPSVGMIVHAREVKGQGSDEVAFFISSLPPQAKRLAGYVRGHGSIENALHCSLDVTFSEDQQPSAQGQCPEIAAVFRRLALSLLKRDTSLKSSLRGKRLQAGWNNEILENILCQKH